MDRSFSRIEKSMHQKASSTRGGHSNHIIPEHTPISDQGRINTCTANNWCDMLEILDGLDGGDRTEQLSRLFLYWIAKYHTGDTDRDAGATYGPPPVSFGRSASSKRSGCPTELRQPLSWSPRGWTSTPWPVITGSKVSTD